jgi:hypothetical protein
VTARRLRPEVTIEARALDLATASAVFALSETALSGLIAHAGFPHIRVGGRVIIPVAQADAWLAARAAGAPLEVAS